MLRGQPAAPLEELALDRVFGRARRLDL